MISVSARKPEKFSGDLLVYCAVQREGKMPLCTERAKKLVKPVWKSGDFSGKKTETLLLYTEHLDQGLVGGIASARILIIGLGQQMEGSYNIMEQLRIAGGMIAGKARGYKAKEVLVVLPEIKDITVSAMAEAMSEGLVLGNYSFDKYKQQDENREKPVKSFVLSCSGSATSIRRGVKFGCRAAFAACTCRDMANEPGNVWTSNKFADFAKKLCGRYKLKCRILEKAAMKKLGMGGIIAVNKGSAIPPKLVILEYISNKKNPTLMIVGKGLTFDSGGVSLKPAAGMQDMKYDMCGGAAVISAMQTVGKEQPKNVNVIALIPTTDNMSGSAAVKPGDIITHFGGKTSEIINTDAEGRLILADALAYGIKTYKPDAVVDLATLTGAVIVGLGHHRTGLLANNDSLAERLLSAGERAAEPLWRLPLGTEYSKQIESKVADIKNTGGKGAGTITAAAYLQEFVGDTPWAHCDIAGTAWGFTEKSYVPKGPSGTGTRTLITLVRNWKQFGK
jgi:leucyl aminopeptidase